MYNVAHLICYRVDVRYARCGWFVGFVGGRTVKLLFPVLIGTERTLYKVVGQFVFIPMYKVAHLICYRVDVQYARCGWFVGGFAVKLLFPVLIGMLWCGF